MATQEVHQGTNNMKKTKETSVKRWIFKLYYYDKNADLAEHNIFTSFEPKHCWYYIISDKVELEDSIMTTEGPVKAKVWMRTVFVLFKRTRTDSYLRSKFVCYFKGLTKKPITFGPGKDERFIENIKSIGVNYTVYSQRDSKQVK